MPKSTEEILKEIKCIAELLEKDKDRVKQYCEEIESTIAELDAAKQKSVAMGELTGLKRRELLLVQGAEKAKRQRSELLDELSRIKKTIKGTYPKLIKLGDDPYGKDKISETAVVFRKDMHRINRPVGGKNIVVLKLKNVLPITLQSQPPRKGSAFTQHSELAAWEAIRSQCRNSGAKIEWLYTERQPCGTAAGHANCDALLQIIMAKHGELGTNTPVYYSFDYPDWRAYQPLINMQLLTEDEAKELAQEDCQISTAELIEFDGNLRNSQKRRQ